MGDDAVGGDASPEQIEKMATRWCRPGGRCDGLVDVAVEHPQRRRRPAVVAQRIARRIGGACCRGPRASGHPLEAIILGCLSGFTDDDISLLTDMSKAADRPLNWNVLGVSAGNPEGHEKQLRASEVAAEHGGRIVALTLPHSTKIRLSFLTGFVLDGLPGWRETMHLPGAERLRALADPEVRRRLNEGAHRKRRESFAALPIGSG